MTLFCRFFKRVQNVSLKVKKEKFWKQFAYFWGHITQGGLYLNDVIVQEKTAMEVEKHGGLYLIKFEILKAYYQACTSRYWFR